MPPIPNAVALHDLTGLRAVEHEAAATLGEFELMRRAGRAAWRELLQHWPQAMRLLVVCGSGNNGGDGYVLATHALCAGRDVRLVRVPGGAPGTAPALQACEGFLAAGGRPVEFDGQLPPADVVVDAVFGIGLSRPPEGPAAALIEAINAHPAPVFALDAPSGLDAGRGVAPGVAVRAERTLEFIARKAGLCTGDALDHVGRLSLAGLDAEALLAAVVPVAEAVEPTLLSHWLAPRPRNSHKGRNGRVLCIGGDAGSGGALLLAVEAALRGGAGLVDAVTRPRHVTALLARAPEALASGCDTPEDARDRMRAADVLAVGPGLGQGEWGCGLLAAALEQGHPLVLDADALNLVASHGARLPTDTILTPHPGEAARLLGTTARHVQAHRLVAVQALATRFGCTVVLKGAGTLVAAPGERPRVIAAGNPGMAVGGMGDVLTGVVAALRAQGLAAFEAATCGALLHAAAGDAAAADGGERGLLPRDLMPWLRRLSNPAGSK